MPKKKPKLIIENSKRNKPIVKVKGANNETVAVTEEYDNLSNAKRATKTVKRVVKAANVVVKKVKQK